MHYHEFQENCFRIGFSVFDRRHRVPLSTRVIDEIELLQPAIMAMLRLAGGRMNMQEIYMSPVQPTDYAMYYAVNSLRLRNLIACRDPLGNDYQSHTEVDIRLVENATDRLDLVIRSNLTPHQVWALNFVKGEMS